MAKMVSSIITALKAQEKNDNRTALDKNGVAIRKGDVVISKYADLVYRGMVSLVYPDGDIRVVYDDVTVKTLHVNRIVTGSSEGFVKE